MAKNRTNFKANIRCPEGKHIKFKNINEKGCDSIKNKLLECDGESSCSINESIEGCDLYGISMNYACVDNNGLGLMEDEEMPVSISSNLTSELIQDSVNRQKVEINSSQVIENFDGSEVDSEDEVNLIKNQQEENSIISEEIEPEIQPEIQPESDAEQNDENSAIVNTDALQQEISQKVATPFNFIKKRTGSKWFWVVIGVIITAILIGIVVFIISRSDDDCDYDGLYGGNRTEIPLNIKSINENFTDTDFSFLK